MKQTDRSKFSLFLVPEIRTDWYSFIFVFLFVCFLLFFVCGKCRVVNKDWLCRHRLVRPVEADPPKYTWHYSILKKRRNLIFLPSFPKCTFRLSGQIRRIVNKAMYQSHCCFFRCCPCPSKRPSGFLVLLHRCLFCSYKCAPCHPKVPRCIKSRICLSMNHVVPLESFLGRRRFSVIHSLLFISKIGIALTHQGTLCWLI